MTRAGGMLGPYELISRLGAGAMGVVWKARDTRLGRLVALKTLPPARGSAPVDRSLMLREARAAAAIPHPGVVTLYDIYSEDEGDFLVMELVEGETLADRVKRTGAVDVREAVRMLVEVTGALAAAHELGIIHRDIKAANIMMSEGGTIKVLDFGLAKLRETEIDSHLPSAESARGRQPTDIGITTPDDGDGDDDGDDSMAQTLAAADPGADETESVARTTMAEEAPVTGVSETMAAVVPGDSAPPDAPSVVRASPSSPSTSRPLGTIAGTHIGTPIYMSPEQARGVRPDAISEVFSVGILGYELVAGRLPYSAKKLDALFEEIGQGEKAPLPKQIPMSVRQIIHRATSVDRDARYSSMAALNEAFRRVDDTLAGSSRRWRRRGWIAAGAIAMVAAGAWMTNHPDPPGATEVTETAPQRPGDPYVDRALAEYEVFYQDKAAALLRSARKTDPDHPRALAYLLLFRVAADGERDAIIAVAERVVETLDPGRDKRLLRIALTLTRQGPAAASAACAAAAENGSSGADGDAPAADDADRELSFWRGELAFRAGDYDLAGEVFAALLSADPGGFRGRIYDHLSAIYLYQGHARLAAQVGEQYAEAFPGEADALGVYATTLAAAGASEQALQYAEEAAALAANEDTLAGLAKVRAYRGELQEARRLYRRAMAMAKPERRVLRRAALGFLALIDGDHDAAAEALAPCLSGGEDSGMGEVGACLWVAGLRWPERIDEITAALEALAAAATAHRPAYGNPAGLANLLRARQRFFAGGCVLEAGGATSAASEPPPRETSQDEVHGWLDSGRDFYASYHVPFFSTWGLCERLALLGNHDSSDPAAALVQTQTGMAADHYDELAPHLLLRLAELSLAGRFPAGDIGSWTAAIGKRWAALDSTSRLRRRFDILRERAGDAPSTAAP